MRHTEIILRLSIEDSNSCQNLLALINSSDFGVLGLKHESSSLFYFQLFMYTSITYKYVQHTKYFSVH